MAKVITLSRTFQKGHPKAGQPTYFVEKVIRSFCPSLVDISGYTDNKFFDFYCELAADLQLLALHGILPKHHTIRGGKRWKTGDMASLRVWSGKPYNSKQITIAPDVELTVKDFEIDEDGCIWIDGKYFVHPEIVAENDGLGEDDFGTWFSKVPFSGQILIWNNHNLPY